MLKVKLKNLLKRVLIITGILTLFSCGSKESITGAGSSFMYPAVSNLSYIYRERHNVNINYGSIGSGGGLSQFMKETILFAGSDRPMPKNYLDKMPDTLHLPSVIGGVVLAYNVPEFNDKVLKLTGDIVVDIYLGKITKWNDKRLQEINPDLKLPDKPITSVHRADGSGTTYIFTRYLSEISNEWKEKVGTSTSVNWPVGIGGKGNEGVAGLIKNLPYTIGYIELAYAEHEHIPFALLRNQKGNYIRASLKSFTEAVFIPDNINKDRFFYDLVNTPSPDGYPITAYAYILIKKHYKNVDCNKVKELVKFLKWFNTDEAQEYLTRLQYAKLHEKAMKINWEILDSVTCNGSKVADN